MKLSAFALALGLFASPALAIDFEANDQGNIDFDMPSGNMCCSYIPDAADGPLLECTRVKPKYWIVQLSADGALNVNKNPGEVPGCGYGEPMGNVFSYGTTWHKGPFKCSSSSSRSSWGCRHRRSVRSSKRPPT